MDNSAGTEFAALVARCRQQLQEQGFAVLPGFLDAEQLEELRLVSRNESDGGLE